MTRKEKIEAIRAEFPKHSKAAYSLAVRTKDTGVMLCPRARELSEGRRKDAHTKQYSLRVRVTKERHAQVKRLIAQEGRFPTVNAWLDWWVWVWISQKEKAAPGADTTEDGAGSVCDTKPLSYSTMAGGDCQ